MLTMFLLVLVGAAILLFIPNEVDTAAILTKIGEVGTAVNKKIGDAEASIAETVKKLDAAVLASKSLEDKVKNLETENADIKSKLRHRNSGGYVEEQKSVGYRPALYIRAQVRKAAGKNEKDMWAGAEFVRDLIHEMNQKRLEELKGIDQELFGHDPAMYANIKTATTLLESNLGGVIPQKLMPIVDITRPNIVADKLGVRVITDIAEVPIKVPKVATKISFAVTGEGKPPSVSDMTLNFQDVYPKGYTAAFQATRRMIEMASPLVDDMWNNQIGAAYAELKDSVLFNGTGVTGQPLGLLQYPTSTGGVQTSTTTSNVLKWGDMIAMITKVFNSDAARYGRYGWACGPLAWGKIMGVTDTAGQPIYTDTNGQNQNKLFTYPIQTTTIIPGTSGNSNGVLMFGDWANAVLFSWLGGLMVGSSEHIKFDQGLVYFRASTDLAVYIEQPTAFCKVTDLAV